MSCGQLAFLALGFFIGLACGWRIGVDAQYAYNKWRDEQIRRASK